MALQLLEEITRHHGLNLLAFEARCGPLINATRGAIEQLETVDGIAALDWDPGQWAGPPLSSHHAPLDFFQPSVRIGRQALTRRCEWSPSQAHHYEDAGVWREFMCRFWGSLRGHFLHVALANGGLAVGNWTKQMGHPRSCANVLHELLRLPKTTYGSALLLMRFEVEMNQRCCREWSLHWALQHLG